MRHRLFQESTLKRRQLLQLTASAYGLKFLLPALEARAADQRGEERTKTLLTVWLEGGPSQLETWDPHPGTLIGGDTKAINTSVPGLQISDFFPQTADVMHHFTTIRSLVSKEGDHERASYFVKTGFRPDPTVKHPALSSIITETCPTPEIEIPTHISLGDSGHPARGGYFGDQYDAFRVLNPGDNLSNLKERVDTPRQQRRLSTLEVVTDSFLKGRMLPTEQSAGNQRLERTYSQALTMMTSDQLTAFDIEQETKETRERYGNSRVGRGCLIARRLVETGVRAIEVSLTGFDSHANNFETQKARSKDLDPALSALMTDLEQRDLLQSTIVLCIGEFGRTPKINPLAGRDHWPTGFSCLVGGGGLKSGLVIGETDPTGESKDPSDPIRIQDLYATILHQFDIDPEDERITPIGRPLPLCEGEAIQRLLT